MKNKIPAFLLEQPSSVRFTGTGGKLKRTFLEKGIHHLADVIKSAYLQWETASKDSPFHRIDARVKVLFLLYYVIIVSLKRELMPEVLIAGFILVLTLVSRLNLIRFYKKVLLLAFFFGFLIALPAALNIITEGKIVFPLVRLSQDYNFWVYHIPREIGITREGMSGVSLLTLRVLNSLSISFLVLSTTSFPDIIKALKVLRVPDSFLMIITLCYKYIFIFAKTVEDMHLARKSRTAGQADNAEARRWIAGRIGFVFKKTRLRCEEIFKAMLGRGFSEDIKLYEPGKLNSHDLGAGGLFFLIGILFLWM